VILHHFPSFLLVLVFLSIYEFVIILIVDILHQDHVTDDGYGGLPSYTSKAYEEYVSIEFAINHILILPC
jgi:hypothetical protein